MFDRLVGWLRSKGVEAHTAEDVAQEAGARALEHDHAFASTDELLAWLRVVAWRLAIDDHRKRSRQDVLVDVAAPQRVDHDVESRVALSAATTAWKRLSDAERDAIAEGFLDRAPQVSRREALTMSMRRSRARAHLVALMHGLAAALVVLGRRLRAPASQLALGVVSLAAIPLIGVASSHAPSRLAEGSTREAPVAAPLPAPDEHSVRARPSTATATLAHRATPSAPAEGANVAWPAAAEVVGPDGHRTGWFMRPEDPSEEPLLCAGNRKVEVHVCTPVVDVRVPDLPRR